MLKLVAKAGADVKNCFDCVMGLHEHQEFDLDTRRKSVSFIKLYSKKFELLYTTILFKF